VTALTQLKLAGTGSFRLASSKLFDMGVNSQNLSKDVLDIVCAPPGWSIVQVDQAGAEALVVAYLTRPGRYRNLFLNGVKAHTYVALQLFLDKFRGEHPRERYWLVDPAILRQYPEFKAIANLIKNSKFEYDIGKRTGHACCDAATEVLTPQGWVAIEKQPPIIKCMDVQTYRATFQPVFWNAYEYEGPMIHFGDALVVTPNHRVLIQAGIYAVQDAQYLAELGKVGLACLDYGVAYWQNVSTCAYRGKVYCPTTATGYFVCRRGDKLPVVTGNSNYRMGPNTFREQCLKESEGTLILDVEQARYFLDTYKQLFPEIVEWQNEIEAQIRSTRTLRNLFGFPRRFERHITDGYIREAISWIPQSTVGCITHRAYREVYDRATSTGRVWRLFNNKHDSFAMLVPDGDIREAAHCMSRAINQELVGRDGEVFRMKSEVQVGKNWGKFDPKHPELNPLGMQDYELR